MEEVCAAKEIRTPTPSYRRYHLKVVRLPISPSPHFEELQIYQFSSS